MCHCFLVNIKTTLFVMYAMMENEKKYILKINSCRIKSSLVYDYYKWLTKLEMNIENEIEMKILLISCINMPDYIS